MAIYDQLIQQLKNIDENTQPPDFIQQFLLAYGFPKATIARLNIKDSITPDTGIGISSKAIMVFTESENLYTKFDQIRRTVVKNRDYRFVVLFNSRSILALDTEANDWLQMAKKDLYQKFEFFLPLMGIEKVVATERADVSVKIGENFAQLYNELLLLNPGKEASINKLMINLIACYFSDSMGLMDKLSIKHWISTYSPNADDLYGLLINVFYALGSSKASVPSYIRSRVHTTISGLPEIDTTLNFDKSTQNLLLKIADYSWSEVEPEVLGALIQAITSPTESGVAYNYTSTANVYKVIGPLFMDDLYEEFERKKSEHSLDTGMLDELSKLRVFDVSCGAGNFLMVAYREIKSLEYHIKKWLLANGIFFEDKEYVTLNQFFGMDTNETAISVTKLGLFFTSLRMKPEGSRSGVLSLPQENIKVGCALDYDWDVICNKENCMVYLIGNPPYKGARKLSEEPKLQRQMQAVFSDEIVAGMKIGDLDYASAWFMKASKYIKGTPHGFAFVTTNSLTQGVHVPTLWPQIFGLGIDISFAHTSFKWKNEGQNTTAVSVVIIGCRESSNPHRKTLYDNNLLYDAEDISPYLTRGNAIVEKETRRPLSRSLPKMIKGNMPYAKALLLEPAERDNIVALYPEARKYFKRVVGSQEYIHHEERWCLWLADKDLPVAREIPLVAEIIDKSKAERQNQKACPQKLLDNPHRFREVNMPQTCTLVVPAVSSENRTYFQVGYVGKNVVVTNLCFVIYDAEPWVFGIIESKMHNLWVRTVCGGLEERPRYSNVLGYNTFPLPELTHEQKNSINQASLGIIMEREKYPEMNLMQLYNDDTMPEGLRYAHHLLDVVVENCYNPAGFQSDQERLDAMFVLYKKMKGV